MSKGKKAKAVDDVVIARIPKNQRETVFVTHGTYNGHTYVGVRVWVPGSEGDLIPTQKGLNLAPDKIPELIASLEEAQRAATQQVAA